jgi:hypothetical protein
VGHFAIALAFLKAFGEREAAAAWTRMHAARLVGEPAVSGRAAFHLRLKPSAPQATLIVEGNRDIESVSSPLQLAGATRLSSRVFEIPVEHPQDPFAPPRDVDVQVAFANGEKQAKAFPVSAPWRVAAGLKEENTKGWWHPKNGFSTNLFVSAHDRKLMAGETFAHVFPHAQTYWPSFDHVGKGACGAVDFGALAPGGSYAVGYASRRFVWPRAGRAFFRLSSPAFTAEMKTDIFIDGRPVFSGTVKQGAPQTFSVPLEKGVHEIVMKAGQMVRQFSLSLACIRSE